MLKKHVLELFGGALKTAERLGITHQAVYKWPEEVPRSAEREVRRVIAEFLKKAGPAK